MKYLGKIEDAKDLTTKEYVESYVSNTTNNMKVVKSINSTAPDATGNITLTASGLGATTKLVYNNTIIALSQWGNDTTYTQYPYKATIPLSNVTNAMIPEVIFGIGEARSGYYAPISATYNGGVYIYATDLPEASITIPTIIIWR